MDKKIQDYLSDNKVLDICTSVDNQPYCASCFYAYDSVNQLLIFSSEEHTNHIKQALANPKVAGTIYTEVTTVAKIRGIQYTGEFINPNQEQLEAFNKVYYKRFPFAKAKPAPLWAVALNWIKMTDNTLGFGKKFEWERS